METELKMISLVKAAAGGGSGGSSDYSDLTNKPKINGNTLSGNKTSSQLGLQNALVSGTNIKTINSTSLLGSGNIDAVSDVQVNGTSVVSSGVANVPIVSPSTDTAGLVVGNSAGNGISYTVAGKAYIVKANNTEITNKSNDYKPIVPSNLNYAVRSVSPACTTITASSTTATISANTTFSHKPTTSATYTLATPADTSTVYNGFILLLDTTNTASIAFQTDDNPAVSVALNGSPTIETGKQYTVTGQFNPNTSTWNLFIISYSA